MAISMLVLYTPMLALPYLFAKNPALAFIGVVSIAILFGV